MKRLALLLLASSVLAAAAAPSNPVVYNSTRNITYHGLSRNGIEAFLNIPYGEDTSGSNRFKPPRLHQPPRGAVINATSYGPACPQALGPWVAPISLSSITKVSEDCLNLNVARPVGKPIREKLPVLVYIHGGSFWAGSNEEVTIRPDGMVLESVRNGLPVVHVSMNYRLGFFGFAQSNALRSERAENAGLKDQRLALEWVRDNIAAFGGDPERVTIFGQSSGGLSVGMHIMAYGGRTPGFHNRGPPFHQAIAQSQSLEPGITGNFSINAMKLVVDHVGCNTTDLHSPYTIACLRALDADTLLAASIATYQSDIAHNIGDIWLPSVDGDFLPDAPSQLIKEHRFSRVTTIMGWCDNDVTFFTDTSIRTAADTSAFIAAYLPYLSSRNLRKLLTLYPVSEFPANPAANLSSEFYRAARIFRDVLMTCQPFGYARELAAAGNTVYLYDWNQTVLDPFLTQVLHQPGMGPIHTSEFAYIFGNLSHYDTGDYAFKPSPADEALRVRASRSWSTFADMGELGREGHDTFRGWRPAFAPNGQASVFVVGGPNEGLTLIEGEDALPAMREQRLDERCAFINSKKVMEQLMY